MFLLTLYFLHWMILDDISPVRPLPRVEALRVLATPKSRITAKRVMEMPSDGLKGSLPEARAQAQSFGSVLAVRALHPRIVVALETPVLAVGLSGGVEKAHLRDWRLLDHGSHGSFAISPARTRFTSYSPPARGQKTFLMFVFRHGDVHLGHWTHWGGLRTHPNA